MKSTIRGDRIFCGEIDWNTDELLKNTYRDAVGSVNIGLAQGESFTSAGVINGVGDTPSASTSRNLTCFSVRGCQT